MPSYTKQAVIDAVLFRGGQPMGAVSVPEEEMPKIAEAIEAAGAQVRPAVESHTAPGVYTYEPERTARRTVEDVLDEPCTEEDDRTCALGLSLAQVVTLAEAAGVPQDQVNAVLDRDIDGKGRDAAVLDAELAILDMMPQGDDLTEARMWCGAAFSDNQCGVVLPPEEAAAPVGVPVSTPVPVSYDGA